MSIGGRNSHSRKTEIVDCVKRSWGKCGPRRAAVCGAKYFNSGTGVSTVVTGTRIQDGRVSRRTCEDVHLQRRLVVGFGHPGDTCIRCFPDATAGSSDEPVIGIKWVSDDSHDTTTNCHMLGCGSVYVAAHEWSGTDARPNCFSFGCQAETRESLASFDLLQGGLIRSWRYSEYRISTLHVTQAPPEEI